MKKIFITIFVIILLFISSLIIWSELLPSSFSKFQKKCTLCQLLISDRAVLNVNNGKIEVATTSEPVTSAQGQVIIRSETWNVEIAATEAERERGLSNRKTLFNKNGMLFVFAKSEAHPFWMKDMIIPIDIIFFDESWRIILIEKNLSSQSSTRIFGTDVKSKYVLEINANESVSFGLAVGDRAIFLNK